MRFREKQKLIEMIILLLVNTKSDARIIFSTNTAVKHWENMTFSPSYLMCYNFRSLYMEYLFPSALLYSLYAFFHYFLLS
jgi:hypothetical protein